VPEISNTRLAATGLLLSVAHLSLLTFILLVMHSGPGWGFYHFAKGTAEVWLGNSGLWLIVFGLTCLALHFLRNKEEKREAPAAIEVRQNGRIVSLQPTRIIWIEAAGNYVEIHVDGATYMLRQSMSDLENQLRSAGFFRSHRRALVNLRHIKAIRAGGEEGAYLVELEDTNTAPLSRRKLSPLRQVLKNSGSEGP
jgi:hypothetical protein